MRGNSQLLVTYDYNEAYLVGEIALLNRVASDHRARAVVLCPNPYQAEMRFQSLSQQCSRLGIEATQIIRRRDATKDRTDGRVIVTTYTSFDIATRVTPEILDGIVYVLIDRLDLIGQPRIGASLETVLVNLMRKPKVQYVAICPPLEDIDELSNWLNAEIVEDPKADVKVIFSVKAVEDSREAIADLTQFVQYRQGQVMVLCANISTSEELALEMAGITQGSAVLDLQLSPEHKDDLIYLAEDVREKYLQCKTTTDLGNTITRGVAFFHEGVGMAQRRVISAAWELCS
jgi:replicative superfamily II helicase